MQTSQIIACDKTKQSQGTLVAVKYSYPSTTSGERIIRTTIIKAETFLYLTKLLMDMEMNTKYPLSTKRNVTIQKAMSIISKWNNDTRPLSIVAIMALACGFYNYYTEHGYIPVPIEILPRANAKLRRGEERAPSRDELLAAMDLSDTRIPRKCITPKNRDKEVFYEHGTIAPINIDDWNALSDNKEEEDEDTKLAEGLRYLEGKDIL